MTDKQEALLAAAKAYYDRGAFVQYDQRSMDRVLELTPRRRKRLPPEAANSQYIQFLDCSGFVSAVYLQVFGYELPSDLTWHMVDLLEPRIYYYEVTHRETVEEMRAVEAQVRALLQPGDLITFDRGAGSGHVVMYTGNGEYTDCTQPAGQKDSYNYVEHKNQIYDQGGIWRRNLDKLFPREDSALLQRGSLFFERIRRFAVSRPLEAAGEILPQARIRMEQARDLWCAVENDFPGCRQAWPGGKVTYTVIVRNQNEGQKAVTVAFAPPAGTVLDGAGEACLTLAGGQAVRLDFSVTVDTGNVRLWLEGPAVTVNGLEIYAHPVLLGQRMEEAERQAIVKAVEDGLAQGQSALEAAARAYAPFGIRLESRESRYAVTHFYHHDSTNGAVLSRFPQRPFSDLAVYSAFGGRGVITPEMGGGHGMRLTYISRRDLQPGDLLLCMEDDFGKQAYGSFFDGESLLGRFGPEEEDRALAGEELDRFVDSLFGRFAFVLLRPWQGHRQS